MDELKDRVLSKYSHAYNIHFFSQEEYVNKLIGYQGITNDLQKIFDFLEKLSAVKNDEIIKSALSNSIIVLYGKCFTSASKNRFPKIENDIFKDEVLKIYHEELMGLRHGFVAHRGKSTGEQAILFMVSPKSGIGEFEIKYEQKSLIKFSDQKIEGFKELVLFLSKEVENRKRRFAEKIYQNYFTE